MRATPRESGRLACPECGGAWTQGQLLDHEIHPYISFGRVLLWTFTMPGVYSVMAVSSCCGCLTMASGAGSWLSEKLMWVGFWLIIGAGVLLMGMWNRGTAGRWASRMTRTPVQNVLRSGGWYWGTLLTVTVVQVVCTFIYPFIAIWLCLFLLGWR